MICHLLIRHNRNVARFRKHSHFKLDALTFRMELPFLSKHKIFAYAKVTNDDQQHRKFLFLVKHDEIFLEYILSKIEGS